MLNKLLTKLTKTGAVGIKTSFEDEGTTVKNVNFLRNITQKTNMELTLKIGGPEAKTDASIGMDIGVDGIVAPMVESDFGAKKFIDFIHSYDTYKGINVETIQGVDNINNIIQCDNINDLDFLCIGRVDLVSSMKKDRNFVNSSIINNLVENTFRQVKDCTQLKCYMGGALTDESFHIIEKLYKLNLIDRVETRYIIFDVNDLFLENFKKNLNMAQLFEYEYMDYLINTDRDYKSELEKRKNMLMERLNK